MSLSLGACTRLVFVVDESRMHWQEPGSGSIASCACAEANPPARRIPPVRPLSLSPSSCPRSCVYLALYLLQTEACSGQIMETQCSQPTSQSSSQSQSQSQQGTQRRSPSPIHSQNQTQRHSENDSQTPRATRQQARPAARQHRGTTPCPFSPASSSPSSAPESSPAAASAHADPLHPHGHGHLILPLLLAAAALQRPRSHVGRYRARGRTPGPSLRCQQRFRRGFPPRVGSRVPDVARLQSPSGGPCERQPEMSLEMEMMMMQSRTRCLAA